MILSSVVLTSMLYGAGGGLLRHLIANHGIALPRWNKDSRRIELGVFHGMLLGSGAGLVLALSDHVSIIVLAVIGGFAGANLLTIKTLDMLSRRIMYTIAKSGAENERDLTKILEEAEHGDHDVGNS